MGRCTRRRSRLLQPPGLSLNCAFLFLKKIKKKIQKKFPKKNILKFFSKKMKKKTIPCGPCLQKKKPSKNHVYVAVNAQKKKKEGMGRTVKRQWEGGDGVGGGWGCTETAVGLCDTMNDDVTLCKMM